MVERISDERRALLLAIALLAIAVLIAFWVRPDPQGHATWFFVVLPGAFAAPAFLDLEWKVFHHAGPAVAWSTEVLFSYVWYFVVSYVAVKGYRMLRGTTGEHATK